MAHLDVCHIVAHLFDHAAEFMAQSQRDLLFGDGMRGGWDEIGTSQVLVEVCDGQPCAGIFEERGIRTGAAYADVCRFHLEGFEQSRSLLLYMHETLAYLDLAFAACWHFNVV